MDETETKTASSEKPGFLEASALAVKAYYDVLDGMQDGRDVVRNVLKAESALTDLDMTLSEILHLRSSMLNILADRADLMLKDFRLLVDNEGVTCTNPSLYIGSGMRDVADPEIKKFGMNVRLHFFDDTLECCRKFDLSKCQIDTYPFYVNRWTFTDGVHTLVISIPRRAETFPREIQDMDIVYQMYVSISGPDRKTTSTTICSSINPYKIRDAVVGFCKEVFEKPFEEIVERYENTKMVFKDYDSRRRMSTISRVFDGEFDGRYFR